MSIILRSHQAKFQQIIDEIIAGSPIKDIFVDCTTGGGKSLLPVLAGKLIIAGLVDKIAWLCPRSSLQDQGERNFLNPSFREELGYSLIIRSATNDLNCSRNTNGIITTYQALSVDYRKTVLRDFKRFRYVLVCDEMHHMSDGGDWTAPVRELYEQAVFRVFLTGTMSRGDCQKIAFVPYLATGDNEFTPCFQGQQENTVLIKYSRTDALAEKAIIPLEFHLSDGVAQWRKESGKETSARLSTSRSDANQALFTALKTEYAEEMLLAGVDHWQNYNNERCSEGGLNEISRRSRREYESTERPGHLSYYSSSLLVVAANIETAKEYTAILRRKGLKAEIATSDDTPDAIKHIKALKAGKLKILVSVAMASEGLDVPSISHIICLTNVRTAPWIEQMCGRAVRIDPAAGRYETQKGYIFAPADRMFTELAQKIEADQCQAVARVKEQKVLAGQLDLFGGEARPGITPLSSRMLDAQRQHIFHYEDTAAPIKTQRELEMELREEINRHVMAFCRVYCVKAAHINSELAKVFGKYRDEMSLGELERLRSYVKRQYSLPRG